MFVDEVSKLIESLEMNVDYLKWKLIRYEKDQMRMDDDTEAFISNPLNGFLLVKHLSLDTHQILQYVHDALDEFSRNTNDLILDLEELTGSVEAIDRLQTTYNLKTEDLANGIIDSDSYNMSLSVRDLFTIGTELQISEKHSRAVEFFIEALKRNQKLNDFDFLEATDTEILNELMVSYETIGDYEKTIVVIDELLKLDLKKADEILSLRNLRKTYEDILKMGGNDKFVEAEESLEHKLTRKVCSDQIKQSSVEKSKLCCKFESKSEFSRLSPFKVEEIHLDPLIIVYHEVVSNNEIEILKQIAKPQLERSVVIDLEGGLSQSTDRTSKTAWLDDENHEIVSRLSKRVEDMTGLSVETAEDLQIQQYGMGGFYKCHYDFDENLKTQNEGDRVATVLFYLSDVEKGGQTVFPFLKTKIFPEKGSAAFWYNLHDSGENAYKTRHAGCPVLVGNKWVANKWLRERGQEWKRPCGTTHTADREVIDYQLYLFDIGKFE